MTLLALPFPAIDPVLVEIGPFAIRWYALAYVAGILFGWWYMRRLVAADRLWGDRKRPTLEDVDDLVVWIVFGVILGGRIGYVLFYNLPYYLQHPLEILIVWEGGMAFHGGLAGVMVAIWIFGRRRGLPFFTLLDQVAAAVPIGLLLGRLANFVNGELYGAPADVPWAVVFPTGGPEPRHPSQLYEAGLEGIVLFALVSLIVWRFHGLRRPGLLSGVFAIGYALARIFVEFFRMPDPQLGYLFGGWLTMGMVLSFALLLAGLICIVLAPATERARPAVPAAR